MPKTIPISIFLHKRVSLSLALLAEFIFNFANRGADRQLFTVRRVHLGEGPVYSADGISVEATTAKESGGYLIIPPIEMLRGTFEAFAEESQLIEDFSADETVIATACLGAFLAAGAGMLDGREATTHWRWGDYATKRFPDVHWNIRSMLCDEGCIITSGGLLSLIDLALYIIAQHCPAHFVHQLGQALLADSVRQKQSVYAQSLVLSAKENDRFANLEQEIGQRLATPFPVQEMASVCRMSIRHFHRTFLENYGVTPNKYLQLKRIEAAKTLLADSVLSIDEVAGRCGFSDNAFFRTVFSRETGLTPSQYRKKLPMPSDTAKKKTGEPTTD